MNNYYMSLAEIKEDKTKTVEELSGAYVEYHDVGVRVGGGFENMNDLKPMKYQAAIDDQDGK